jgi:integrase
VNGKLCQESTKSESLMVAENLLRDRIGKVEQALPVAEMKKLKYEEIRKTLIQDYRTRGVKMLEADKEGNAYVWGFEHLDSYFKNRAVRTITTNLLYEFIEKRQSDGAKNATINRNLSLLRRMMSLARREGKLAQTPYFPMLKEDNVRKGLLTPSQFIKLRDTMPEYLRPLVTFLYFTGCRIGVRVEGKRVKFHGKTYDDLQIWTMLMHSDDPEQPRPNLPPREKLVVTSAALTGLRMAELRGLRWGDFDGENLHVKRSVWRTTVNDPKTESSEASVPVVPVLGDALKEYRKTLKEGAAADTAYIFAGERRDAPLNLANLARRVIIPAFTRCKIPWLGWHAFRRSTGSLLDDLGVEPKITQQILRHADIRTTMNIYVKPDSARARKAMKERGDNLLPFGY